MSKAIIILKLFLNINDYPWQWETALKKDILVAFEITHISMEKNSNVRHACVNLFIELFL